MLKFLLIVLTSVSTSVFAASDPCWEQLSKKYRADAKASPNWGFEGFYSVKKVEAIELVEGAYDLSTAEREDTIAKIERRGTLAYQLFWNAPANLGQSVIVAQRATCAVIAEVVTGSDE